MTTLNCQEYDALVRTSTKGNKKAIEDIFTLGESLLVKNSADAAEAFKDAAISYRIASFRNGALLEDSQNEVSQLVNNMNIFREWITTFSNGHVALPKAVEGLNKKDIEDVIYGECKYPSAPEVIRYYQFVNQALELTNEDYAKLNGNRPLFICDILLCYFGLAKGRNFDFPNASIDVRIGVDLLAHRIQEKITTNARL